MTALVVGEVLVELVWRIDAALGSPETLLSGSVR
jgi:hypothetical protein